MSRHNRFTRDLHAIHGAAEFRVISDDAVKVDDATALSLTVVLAVFVIALVAFLCGMLVVFGIFAYSAFVPHPSLDADLISETFRTVLTKA